MDIPSITRELQQGRRSVDEVRQQEGISNADWCRTANKIYQCHLETFADPLEDEAKLVAEVNDLLVGHAFCCPPYVTVPEAQNVLSLLADSPEDVPACIDTLGTIVMEPRMRALQTIGRFRKVPLFSEFDYLVEAAAKSFYSGNTPSALITAIPVVEGMLLRWQGYPRAEGDLPEFKRTKKFIGNSHIRNPVPKNANFHKTWISTVDAILQRHFYLLVRPVAPLLIPSIGIGRYTF